MPSARVAGRPAARSSARRRREMPRAHDRVHEPDAERFLAATATGPSTSNRGRAARRATARAHGAAETGMDAELYLRQPERALVTPRRRRDSGTRARARVRRRARSRRSRRPSERRAPRSDRATLGPRPRRVRLGPHTRAGELLDVRAEDESAALARLDDEAANVGSSWPSSSPPSSSNTSCESVLTLAPALSSVSQQMLLIDLAGANVRSVLHQG